MVCAKLRSNKGTLMRSLILFLTSMTLAIAGSAMSFGVASAASADRQYSTALGFNPQNGNQTVCCRRGRQDWWSTWNQCYAAGGQPTANRACRDNNGYDDNDGYGGGQYQDSYGNPDRRVCCYSRYGIGWASWRQCRRARGEDVANKTCRKTRRGFDYNRLDQGGYDDGYSQQDPNRRVCCKRGYADWWSSWRECRRAGGYETANRECRRD